MGENQRAGGERLKHAIRVARARADITSDTELALKANVSYDTLMNWYSGRTTPRPNELRKVAATLGVRLSDLMDAFDGREPVPPTLDESIRMLVDEIRGWRMEDRQRTRSIMRAIGAVLPEMMPELRPAGESVTSQYVTDGDGDRTA